MEHSSGRLDILPVSNGLRAALITSHNIYYVKSDTFERRRWYFSIILCINILHNADSGIVNNFLTTFDNRRGFRAQTIKRDRGRKETVSHMREERRRTRASHNGRKCVPRVASLLGELVCTRSTIY